MNLNAVVCLAFGNVLHFQLLSHNDECILFHSFVTRLVSPASLGLPPGEKVGTDNAHALLLFT